MEQNSVRLPLILLSLSGALAVLLGAFGAHALRTLVSDASIQVWKTASFYHFIHVLAAMICLLLPGNQKVKRVAFHLFFWGTICFSGSLYLLSTREAHHLPVAFLGPVTPAGGLLLTAGWLAKAWSMLKPAVNGHNNSK